jgi:hypothetical protein
MDAKRLVGVTLWRVFIAAVGWYGFDQITDAIGKLRAFLTVPALFLTSTMD